MVARKSWLDWWLKFLDVGPDGSERALEVLARRYVEEKQHSERFIQHAQRMQYPQFRHKLLAIAAAETEHADCLAEKIKSLGGRLPDVPAAPCATKTSWQYLLEDLTEEQLCAGKLFEEACELREELPAVSELLQHIYDDESAHCSELRNMLMRSDPQSHLATRPPSEVSGTK